MSAGFSLTAEQEEIGSVVRAVAESKAHSRRCFDGGPSLDGGLWRAMVEVGVAGLGLGSDNGGIDAGLIEQALVAEEIGRVAAAVPFLASTVVSGMLLAESGSASGSELVRSIAAGEIVAATAFSGHEDLGDDAVTAREANGTWAVTGEIPFVVGGDIADILVVHAPVEGGLALFAADASSGGVEVEELPTLDPTRRAASVAFGDAGVERIDGDGNAEDLLARARMRAEVILAAEALGAAAAALDKSTDHALNRVQFGRPIGQFQAVKHTLADMLVDVENARSAVYNAAWTFDGLGRGAGLDVAMAKALATENAVSVVNRAIQIHGGMGVTWEDDLHLMLRRAKSCALLLGDPGFHFDRIAASLLDDPVSSAVNR